MKPIIAPIDKETIKAELAKVTFLRNTNFGENEIYEFSALESPILMREVGRLRELAFRCAGGGTGDEIDIDNFDTDPDPYIQLIVWNPEEEEIIGGYRYFACLDKNEAFYQNPVLATTDLFNFSEKFNSTYLPLMIELCRTNAAHPHRTVEQIFNSFHRQLPGIDRKPAAACVGQNTEKPPSTKRDCPVT